MTYAVSVHRGVPKNIPLTEAIQELTREWVKQDGRY